MCQVVCVYVFCSVQMFEAEEDGAIVEDELAVILRTALGVADLTVCDVFRAIDAGDTGKITFGKCVACVCVSLNRCKFP